LPQQVFQYVATESDGWRLSFALTRILPAILITCAAGGLAYVLLVWSADRADFVSSQRQEKLVALVVSQLRARIAHDQESATVWDEAVQKVRADDTAWMDSNLGSWMHTYFGLDGAYVLNPADRPIYAFTEDHMAQPDAYAAIAPRVAPLVHALRQALSAPNPPKPAHLFLSPGVADFAIIRGHPAVVSVKPIVSDSGKIVQAPGHEYLHVAVRFLDGSFATRLAHDYLFSGLHAALRPMPGGREASYPIKDNAGQPIGYFLWRPYRPGEAVLSDAIPVLGGLLGLTLLTVLGFLGIAQNRVLRLRAAEARLHFMAFHDPLTALPNRRRFGERVEQELASLCDESLALLYLDLDFFKQVNDMLGHPAGDQLIRAFAGRLTSLVGEAGVVARLGGDEFTILLQAVGGEADVTAFCDRVLESARSPFDLGGHQIFAGVSIGIALAPRDGVDGNELIRKADIALYSAKSLGRGRAAFFDPSMDDAVHIRQEIERDLRAALRAGDAITVHYQPIHAAADHAIIGCEALLRWQHPERGWISPELFIPIAEEAGLMDALGQHVLRTACAAATQWPHLTISVNASGVELANPAYAARVAAILQETELEPHRLEIEITETAANRQIHTAADNLQALRKAGVRIAIDDFGTGFSSMARLQQIEVDRVKIDRSFILGFGDQSNDQAVVEAIINLAHAKGLRVTAEGVETALQRTRLTEIGCDDLQGFVFSAARPAREITTILDAADGRPASNAPRKAQPESAAPA
jgi:diguanylate cyclase (GGDEF)-like protein